MKITIEPTEKLPLAAQSQPPKVSIEIKDDCLDINDMFETLIIPALLASGFTRQTIEQYLGLKE